MSSDKAAVSDGTSAAYYELPAYASELQDLINYNGMSSNVGEAFRALYRMGKAPHSDVERDLNKAIFYLWEELYFTRLAQVLGAKNAAAYSANLRKALKGLLERLDIIVKENTPLTDPSPPVDYPTSEG